MVFRATVSDGLVAKAKSNGPHNKNEYPICLFRTLIKKIAESPTPRPLFLRRFGDAFISFTIDIAGVDLCMACL